MSNRERHQIGVIGCGFIWRDVYLPTLLALRHRVEVAAVCDLDPRAAAAAAGAVPGARVHLDPGECVSAGDLDAVVVLTAESANAACAALALEADLSVYLEKPPAVSVGEWRRLTAAQEASGGRLFTAFNRRHTPALQGWAPPPDLRRVHGRLCRRGRGLMGFPHTAVHLIDSVQYFSGAPLTGWEVRLATFDGAPGWRVSGELGPRATCELIFLPAAEIKCEYLVFEGDGAPQRLEFPDIDTKGNHWETLGYAPGFRAFLDTLEGRANPRHRLEHCLPTVSILEEMLAALRSDPAVPTR